MDDIDFVVTWVNEGDTEWLEARQEALRRFAPRSAAAHSEGVARYRDLGTLRYWFRAVEQNAPWVRRIHFVTECRLPDWLRTDHPKLHVVDGRAINPTGATTFNSHAVEACIPLIPDLAEQFVYFNDDFFVSNPVAPEFYFKKGVPYAYPFPTMLSSRAVNTHARLNACGVINDHFTRSIYVRRVLERCWSMAGRRDVLRASLYGASKQIPPITDIHLPTPLRKSLTDEAFDAASDLIEETRRSVFRSVEDVAPIYLAMMWHIGTGDFFATSKRQSGVYTTMRRDSGALIARTIADRKIPQFCVNDGVSPQFHDVHGTVLASMQRKWPHRSTFESS